MIRKTGRGSPITDDFLTTYSQLNLQCLVLFLRDSLLEKHHRLNRSKVENLTDEIDHCNSECNRRKYHPSFSATAERLTLQEAHLIKQLRCLNSNANLCFLSKK